MSKQNSAVSGTSLVELLVAIGIGGALVVCVGALVVNQQKTLRQVEYWGEAVDLLNLARSGLDCSKTFANIPASDVNRVNDCRSPSTSSSPHFIDLRDEGNVVFVAQYQPGDETSAQTFGTDPGRIRARARCVWQNGWNGVVLEYKKDGLNPLTGTPDTWRAVGSRVPLSCP